jgi:general secretion pathway protein D
MASSTQIAALALLALPAAPFAAPLSPARAPQQDAAQQGTAPPPIQEQGDSYILNFSEDSAEQVSLQDFVKLCQQATGRNFTYGDDTTSALEQAKIRMFGTKRIPKEDFYQFFQIMMFIHDFVTVEVGPRHLSVVVVQALNSAGAQRNTIRQRTTYVLPEELEDYVDQPASLITTVLHLPNTDVRQLPTTLRPLMADQTTQGLVSVGNTNSIILQGFGSQVAALAKLLYIVDEESALVEEEGPLFDTIPLEFASAEEVAELLDQLLSARTQSIRGRPQRGQQAAVEGGIPGQRTGGDLEPEVLVDHRTNSLIVMALRADMPSIKELVARLDVDVVEPERNYHIYSLENVQAEDIARVLDDFLRDAARITEGATATGGRTQGQGATTSSSSRSNEVVVVPDPETNSLLIAAGKTRFEEVLELLRQLDKRQDQVLIETALIEVSGTTSLNIGVNLLGADIPSSASDPLGVFGSSSQVGSAVDFNATGNLNSLIPGGFTAGIIDFDTFTGQQFIPALISLVETRADTNILNVPSVLVNNNGTATVRSADERPTTTTTVTGATGTQQTNFQGYQEATVELTISPSISAKRYLRLGITLSVSTFGEVEGGSLDIPPPRITRELRTTVNVPDGDTMVVGGLVVDNKSHGESRVPWLADIPLIGHLFRSEGDSTDRTTLYFFVTPYIMRDLDFADLSDVSFQKKFDAARIIGLDRVQKIDPSFGAEHDEIDLSSFDVPLYRAPDRGEVGSEDVGIDPVTQERLLREAAENENED